jgi:hypothetical protein
LLTCVLNRYPLKYSPWIRLFQSTRQPIIAFKRCTEDDVSQLFLPRINICEGQV